MSDGVKEIRILSIYGCGIRGIISAIFIYAVEERLNNKSLYEYFDIICGTSTGTIVALSAFTGIKMNFVVEFYKSKCKSIFKKEFFRKLKKIIVHKSLYNPDILYKELE
jgi:patatin-like phospholipase/acyl hydrolase